MQKLPLVLRMITTGSILANDNKLILKPDDEDKDAGQIFVGCKFDEFPQTCFLDTGANLTAIQENDFFSKYKSIGTKSIRGAVGQSETCDLIRISHQVLADSLSHKDATVLRCPTSLGRPSTIGIDSFKGSVIHFDFGGSTFSVQQGEDKRLVNQGAIQDRTRFLEIPVNVGGGTQTVAIWDTGAGLSSVDTGFVEKHPSYFEALESVDVGNTIGATAKMKTYRVKSLTVGGVHFDGIRVIAFDFTPLRGHFGSNVNILIGYNIITKADWTVDFSTGRWGIQKIK